MSRGPRRGGAFIALPATLLLLISSLAGATPVRQGAALAPESGPSFVSLVIETTSPEAVAELVTQVGGQVTWRFENLDALSVTLPADRVGDVMADSRVGEVAPAREVRRAVVTPDFPRLLSADGFRRSRPLEHDGTTFPAPDADRWSVRPLPVSEILSPARGGATESFGFHPAIGAQEVWEQTGAGEGIIVAIIDTGVHAEHPLLEGNTIGGFNLVPPEEEMAIDLDGNGEGDGRHYDWDSVHNNSHGTFVGGIIAGHAELELPADDPFAVSVQTNQPNAITFEDDVAKLNLLGVAPGASLYGVKVFPYDGGSAPDARVAEAIDRLISMKRRGELDTHVINMSLSGPVLFDGWNPLDRMIDRATFYGITCVCAAANDGPALLSVGSPGSAFTAPDGRGRDGCDPYAHRGGSALRCAGRGRRGVLPVRVQDGGLRVARTHGRRPREARPHGDGVLRLLVEHDRHHGRRRGRHSVVRLRLGYFVLVSGGRWCRGALHGGRPAARSLRARAVRRHGADEVREPDRGRVQPAAIRGAGTWMWRARPI